MRKTLLFSWLIGSRDGKSAAAAYVRRIRTSLASMKRNARRIGFTLLELLVVLVVISLLMAILVPALNKTRGQAKKTKCAAQLRQIAMAFGLYASNWGNSIIVAKELMSELDGQLAWNFELLPYFGGRFVPGSWKGNRVPEYFCPEDRDPYPLGYGAFWHSETQGYTSYGTNGYYPPETGRGGLGPAGGYKTTQVPHPSSCMLLFETSHAGQIYDAEHPAAQRLGLAVSGKPGRSHHRSTSGFYHGNSMNVAFLDAHVHAVPGKRALTTVWPEDRQQEYKAGKYMFWPDLTLDSAAENPEFWGPGYK